MLTLNSISELTLKLSATNLNGISFELGPQKLDPQAKVYAGAIHQAYGVAVQWSGSGGDTRLPTSSTPSPLFASATQFAFGNYRTKDTVAAQYNTFAAFDADTDVMA